MLEEARKLCSKSARTRIIVLAVIIVIGLVAPMLAPINYIFGPKDLTGKKNLDYASYKGKYVEYDVKYTFGSYVETTSTTTQNGRKVSSKKVSYGYIAYNFEDNTCFAVELPIAQDKEMEKILEQTATYIYDQTEPTRTVKVKGTMKAMDSKEKGYFTDSLEELEELFPGITDSAKYYKIVDGEVNGIKKEYVLLIYYVIAILLMVIVYTLIRVKTGGPDSKLKKFIAAMPGLTEEQVDADMNSAVRIGKNLWAGNRFTVWRVGLYINIINNKNLVWAYYYQRTGRNSVSQTRTFNKDHKMVAINISREDSDKLLQAYADTQPQMVLGYKKELEKQYNKDFAGFLNLRFNQAQNVPQNDNFDELYNAQFRPEDYEPGEPKQND